MLKIGRNQRLEYLKKSKKEQKNTNKKTEDKNTRYRF